MVEWLYSGLQNRRHRFDSGPSLQSLPPQFATDDRLWPRGHTPSRLAGSRRRHPRHPGHRRQTHALTWRVEQIRIDGTELQIFQGHGDGHVVGAGLDDHLQGNVVRRHPELGTVDLAVIPGYHLIVGRLDAVDGLLSKLSVFHILSVDRVAMAQTRIVIDLVQRLLQTGRHAGIGHPHHAEILAHDIGHFHTLKFGLGAHLFRRPVELLFHPALGGIHHPGARIFDRRSEKRQFARGGGHRREDNEEGEGGCMFHRQHTPWRIGARRGRAGRDRNSRSMAIQRLSGQYLRRKLPPIMTTGHKVK